MTPPPSATAAFKAWVYHVGTLDDAARITGISRRRLQRMFSGAQPVPARLLMELAEGPTLAAQGKAATIAAKLRRAAQPAPEEPPHA